MFEQARNAVSLDDYPVHMACRDGDVQSLTKYVGLRQDKSCLVQEDNFYFWTPLHFASFFGQLPALIILREAGVSVDITTARFQQTAAHIAAFAGADHCLKYLVHFGCNVNKQDYLGETPLHKAARSGSVPCGRALAADGRALPHVLNSSGQTAAALASACGHAEMAACLAEYERSTAHQTAGGAAAAQCAPVGQGALQASGVGQPALNGGLVPERTAAPNGHWCYQPPYRPSAPAPAAAAPAAGSGQMDTDGGGVTSEMVAESGHFLVRHQSNGLAHTGQPNGVQFSATVGSQNGGGGIANVWHGNGLLGVGSQGNGFRKRSHEDVFCEDIKRRRLLDCAGGEARQAVPAPRGVTSSGLMGPD